MYVHKLKRKKIDEKAAKEIFVGYKLRSQIFQNLKLEKIVANITVNVFEDMNVRIFFKKFLRQEQHQIS